jgi:hypothetical protein
MFKRKHIIYNHGLILFATKVLVDVALSGLNMLEEKWSSSLVNNQLLTFELFWTWFSPMMCKEMLHVKHWCLPMNNQLLMFMFVINYTYLFEDAIFFV